MLRATRSSCQSGTWRKSRRDTSARRETGNATSSRVEISRSIGPSGLRAREHDQEVLLLRRRNPARRVVAQVRSAVGTRRRRLARNRVLVERDVGLRNREDSLRSQARRAQARVRGRAALTEITDLLVYPSFRLDGLLRSALQGNEERQAQGRNRPGDRIAEQDLGSHIPAAAARPAEDDRPGPRRSALRRRAQRGRPHRSLG